MNKDELVELLKNYKENKSRLKIKLKDLKNERIKLQTCEDIETSITSAYGVNLDIHSKNSISDKVLKKIEENDAKKKDAEKTIKELEKEVKDLRYKTESVEDRLEALKYKEHKILTSYYITGRTAQDIADNLYKELFGKECTVRYIQTIVEKAIHKMANL